MSCGAAPANAERLSKWQGVPASTKGEYQYIFDAKDIGNCALTSKVESEFRAVVAQRANVKVNCVQLRGASMELRWSALIEAPLIGLVPTYVDAGCSGVYWQVREVNYFATSVSSTSFWDKVGYWLNPFDPRLGQDVEAYIDKERDEAGDKLAGDLAKLILPIVIPVALLGFGYLYVTRRRA